VARRREQQATTQTAYEGAAPRDLKRERKALVSFREDRLRDLGGLALEMYKRDRFDAGLVVERCAELVAVEARVQEIDALLDGSVAIRGDARRQARATATATTTASSAALSARSVGAPPR